MTLQALIFDVDGVLADTEESHRVAFNLAFAHFALGWSWSRREYRALLRVTGGKERLATWIDALPVAATEQARLRTLVPALHAEKTRFYTQVVRDGMRLRDGVERLLHEARGAGCRIGIASTTSAPNIEALLAATLGPRGRGLFDAVACGDEVPAKKPSPDVYLLALAKLGVAPEHAAAVEDSENGVRAAVAAGLWAVVTPTYWTATDDFEDAGLVLPGGLGDPARPLADEPGERLSDAPWLGFAELSRRARGARLVAALAPSIEEGAHR